VDPKKQTEFIEHTDELASQFDYTHSQVNEKGGGSKAKELEKPVDAKIYHPQYWLSIIVAVAIYSVIASYLSTLLTYAIYVGMLVFVFQTISRLKKRGKDDLTQGDKYKMVLFMAFEPVVAQALYYYRLRKTMPKAAGIALSIGWKVFLLFMIGIVIYVFIAVTQSWQYRYGSQFQVSIDNISSNLSAITADAKEYDSLSLIANCKRLSDNINVMKKIPPFPDIPTQSALKDALTTLQKGAGDCVVSVRNENPPLLKQSDEELKNGFDQLKQAIKLMKNSS
jgi:hypothetical protein